MEWLLTLDERHGREETVRTALPPTPEQSRPSDLRNWYVVVFVMALSASLARALAVPLFGSADEVGHFDYAYQVWHGRLPDFYEGVVVDQIKGQTIPVQWVSQHPPLFYVLLAPIIGPLTDSHHVLVAGLAARGVNALFGALVPVAVMWGVRQAFPGMNRLAVTSGLVSATPPWLHGVSGAIYNDALATLLGTLVIGLTCRILRRGSPRHEWVWLAVACAAAAATRLATVAVIAVCLVCLVVNGLASDQGA